MGIDLTGLGSIADLAQDVVNRIWPPSATTEEKSAAQIEMEKGLMGTGK